MKIINLNSYIFVKLTRDGYQRLADLHNEYVGVIPSYNTVTLDTFRFQADKDGYTKMQAWCFIQRFGPVTKICSNYYDLDILIEDSEIKENK